MTIPPYDHPQSTAGPSIASSSFTTASASSSSPLNGRSGARFGTPRSSSCWRTSSQTHASWKAPWTNTTVVMTSTLSGDAHPLQFPAHGAFDRRAVEERRVGARPQRHRVLEREPAEVGLGGVALLHQLPRFGQHLPDVRNVPVPDVRREQRLEPGPTGATRVERQRGHGIVGLAAEVVAAGEAVADLVGVGDAATRELVQRGGILVGEAEHAETGVELVEPFAVARRPVLLEQRLDLGAVQVRRVVVLDRVAVALLPVPDEVRQERGRPRDTTFLEREAQLREALRHAAHEQRE